MSGVGADEPVRLVTDPGEFGAIVDEVAGADVYALDTEFHREKTYYPHIALVQIAWRDGLAVVDPTVLDLKPFAKVLEGPGLAVLHASDQDLEVLDYAAGAIPTRLFDTQIAAGFLGMSSPSLASLHERELGIRLPKGDRLTDWLRRPLEQSQLDYAASDVRHLLEVYDRLVAQLDERGRLEWAQDECEAARGRPRTTRDPDEAWYRIKEARSLRGEARTVARAVAAWRERRAADLDLPVRYVMPDLAIVAIANRPPTTLEQLRRLRGVDERHLKGEMAERLLALIAEARTHTVPRGPEPTNGELDRELRPAVTLVSAWVSQLARERHLDTALLATRSDIEALLRGDADARLTRGWRAELVGEPIRKLVSGEAALAFDGKGGLTLEARSHTPL